MLCLPSGVCKQRHLTVRDVAVHCSISTLQTLHRGKVLVLENGMKFHEVGVTNKDAQFLELRKFQITDIARLFRVPPHMIADLERATFSNIEQQSLEFVMHNMTP